MDINHVCGKYNPTISRDRLPFECINSASHLVTNKNNKHAHYFAI